MQSSSDDSTKSSTSRRFNMPSARYNGVQASIALPFNLVIAVEGEKMMILEEQLRLLLAELARAVCSAWSTPGGVEELNRLKMLIEEHTTLLHGPAM